VARAPTREVGTLARTGGDEFTVLLPELLAADNADLVARRILQAMAQPFPLVEREIFTTPSIGIAVYPGDGTDAEGLLSSAELAMYQAKQHGRNRSEFYRKELNQRSLERLELESELRRAIERQELLLYYQPKVDVITGRISGAEALVRWQHPQRGLVPPLEFIPIAEDNGMIVEIGEWILLEVCRQSVEWTNSGLRPLRLAVNISSHQLSGNRILEVLGDALTSTRCTAANLVLELTESMLMSNAESAIALLSALKALGPSLSIDDFGTGYSSLSYLKRFPLDELKIDRSFVMNLPDDETDVSIVRAIVALAHALELKVVAEGVEERKQLDTLAELGCETFQGYYFSRPVPAGEFRKLVEQQGVEVQ